MAVIHEPIRPEWTCGACGKDWPCDPARVELAEKYAGNAAGLGRHMGAILPHAARETQMPAKELYERFVQWVVPA